MSIKQRSKRQRSGRMLFLLSFLLMIIVSASLIGRKYYNWIFDSNVSLSNSNSTSIYIPSKATFEDLMQILEAAEILKSTKSFRWLAEQKQFNRIKPGRYILNDGMSNNALVNKLRAGQQSPVNVTFNNIRTKEELSGVISQYIEADSISLLNKLNDSHFLNEFNVSSETVLILFLPNTYELWWNTNAEDFIKRMHREYHSFWNDERKRKAKNIGLSMSEVSVLAAIVDEETIKSDEKPKVAGLYLNRLNKNIRLQADPTVKYALGDFSIQRVLKKDLEIDSPYNTYRYAGLPPGPIRVPSISGINAVLNRTKHNYLYMCAKEDFSGYHNFAKTLAQHNRNAAKFQRALNKKRIYR